jgi:hypothetical protein
VPGWQVTLSDRFLEQLRGLGPEGYDWSESLEGFRWYLSRGPDRLGHGTQDLAVRFFSWTPPQGPPLIKVFYLVEPGGVTVLFVRVADPFPF